MIGLIFGETDFPKKILKKIKRIKKKYLIIDLTKNKTFKKNKHFNSVSIGQIGKIINILKINKCKKVLFAGKVNKPIFSNLKLDLKGVYYIPRIIKASKVGDAAILKEIINIFKIEKIKTLNSLTFNPELSLTKGIHTKIKPNNQDQQDIRKCILILNKLNNYTEPERKKRRHLPRASRAVRESRAVFLSVVSRVARNVPPDKICEEKTTAQHAGTLRPLHLQKRAQPTACSLMDLVECCARRRVDARAAARPLDSTQGLEGLQPGGWPGPLLSLLSL